MSLPKDSLQRHSPDTLHDWLLRFRQEGLTGFSLSARDAGASPFSLSIKRNRQANFCKNECISRLGCTASLTARWTLAALQQKVGFLEGCSVRNGLAYLDRFGIA